MGVGDTDLGLVFLWGLGTCRAILCHPGTVRCAQNSLANEGDGVGGGRQALGDQQEEDRLGQEH